MVLEELTIGKRTTKQRKIRQLLVLEKKIYKKVSLIIVNIWLIFTQ